ncbi:MAG: leucine--tRNA ligase [Candidatus Diapherotrites archaeon]
MSEFNFREMEEKWQREWEKAGIFEVKEDKKKKKFYMLEMFPYPSGKLHMGHVRNYSIGDSIARFKRMQGFNVLYPMGYDALGLPAENAAIKEKVNPKKWTYERITEMKGQQKMLGFSYDWSRTFETCDPSYYKWNQWIFLKLYEKGLAYKKKASVNYCPKCNTVLANEQVIQDRCWRCKSGVELKELEQWFFAITKYAEELLEGLKKLDGWPEKVKLMQENWIGKSKGTDIYFQIKDSKDRIAVFTTRPDTIYGVTYLVLSPEYPKVREWVKGTRYEKELNEFIREVKKKSVIEREEKEEKNGLFIGKHFINPVNNESFPIYVADYIVSEYGSGAVMAVPAHDQRDFEFAKKYKLPIKIVIQPQGRKLNENEMKEAFAGEGVMVNSGKFNGMESSKAIEAISDFLEEKALGKRSVQFRLKDWLISRQRYWGTPIPIIYCEKCGVVPVPEKDLPVLLPEKAEFTGEGNPLDKVREFIETKCPKCGGKARRETDTMDTFVDSSWYFLRYTSPKSSKIFDKEKAEYWMPVSQYIGGIEHATGHLIYARFFTKILRDLKLFRFDEPFARLLTQGMVLKDGKAMSKSLGNVVSPEETMKKFGADATRCFVLFVSSPESEMEWNDKGIESIYRFLNRVQRIALELKEAKKGKEKELNRKSRLLQSITHRTIKTVTGHLEGIELNKALMQLMQFESLIEKCRDECNKEILNEAVKVLVLMLAPFAPHLCEELWKELRGEGFVSFAQWPAFDERKIDVKAEAEQELIERTIEDIKSIQQLIKKEKLSKITIFAAEKWKWTALKKIFELKKEGKMISYSDAMKAVLEEKEVKDKAKEAAQFVQSITKKVNEMRELIKLDEFNALKEAQGEIEREFECKVEIIKAEASREEKARRALPLKPAIQLS